MKYVRDVQYYPDEWYKEITDPESILSLSEISLFNDTMRKNENKESVLVSYWSASQNLSYFSVKDSDPNKSRIGRSLVQYCRRKNTFLCECRKEISAKICAHIAVAKVYGRIKGLVTSCTVSEEKTSNSQEVVSNYFLSRKEAAYQLSNKKYPCILPQASLAASVEKLKQIKHLMPSETECSECWLTLEKRHLYCRSGVIIDTDRVYKNVHLYFRMCPKCKVRYYYKESTGGIHVSDNNVILTFRCAILIRSFLQNNTAIEHSVKSIEATINALNEQNDGYKYIKLNENAMRRSYLLFEIFTEREYNFQCGTCGKYPAVLISDVCRKTFHPIEPMEKDLLTDGPKDMALFWHNVELGILTNQSVSNLLPNWSGYMNPSNVKDGKLMSTEKSKGSKTDVDFNESFMLSPEEILNTINITRKSEVKKALGKLGVTVHNDISKDHLKTQLHKKINDTPAFKKKLFSILSGTGGYLALMCPHGVCYAVKNIIKFESPSDYVDLILSMRIPPVVLIVDMPDRVSENLNRRAPELLAPNNGMFVEANQENINAAKKGQSFYLEALNRHLYGDSSENALKDRRIYIAYDRFHKFYPSKETEICRSVDIVENMPNTQVVKQFNSRIGRINFDKLPPLTHCFYVRLVVNLNNLALNLKQNMRKKALLPGMCLDTDKFGRIYHSVPKHKAKIDSYEESSSESDCMEHQEENLYIDVFDEADDFMSESEW